MPFHKVDNQINFSAQEQAILAFWQRTRAFERLCELRRTGPRWSFLDGPITANNPMGVHHAWGRTYKDAYQRYFAMTGHQLRYQNGFDCQGLWVEVEVEKELKLGSKRDIENLVPDDRFRSIDQFVHECKNRVNKFARIQTDQSIRLGYWMDWDRTDADWAKAPGERKSYFTMAEENNYTIWTFLKKCYARNLIYKSYDAMPWCGRCGTGISQQEMNEGYHLVAHRSVFVKFPLRQCKGENLLIWTTTPWTLSSNVAAAVNPELRYLKVKHKDEIYYVAKGAFTTQRLEEQFKRKEWVEGVPKLKTLEQLFKEKGGYEIVGEVMGADLVGQTYDGPFDELLAQQQASGYPTEIARIVRQQKWGPDSSAKDIHRVVPWEAVGETEGTGIVHIAPGCGKEDFQLGKEQNLVPVAPLDDNGIFLHDFGELSGRSATDPATTDWIIENLQKKNLLLAFERYPHSYPHCWRCKTELLFRLVDEWFINMNWRDEIMNVVEQVTFLPESINGKARELDWLRNMGDWMISKKRYWGLALPIWVDEESGDFEVIGSYEELKARAVEGWEQFEGHSPHRPWIDLVKIKNPKTGRLMSRIPDVGNPWLDAGIVPYSTMKYNTDRTYWKQWFPADFITECFPGQFRNWFYAILAMSTMMEQKPPFKVLLGHALVRDQKGDEMHKSKGNAIPFDGAVDTGYELFHERDPKQKIEAQASKDLPQGWIEGSIQEKTILLNNKPLLAVTAKYPPMSADVMRWMYCRQAPASNINFGPITAEEVRSKFILKLWNTYGFFCNYARLDEFNPNAPQIPMRDRPDIDRWIVSDLQLLIQKAHASFTSFNIQAFCLAVEEFVDEKLSNWYVRRNRKRFWKSDKGQDKQAAYQTLYTVLVTLTKLIAPVVPFLAETLYQNLVVQGQGKNGATSVHHELLPQPDEELLDTSLSEEMATVLRMVSLGLSMRNNVKIKVRQPLACLKIIPAHDEDRRAVNRFADQICDELNVKTVMLHDEPAQALIRYEVKLNLKTAGSKLGSKLKEAQTWLGQADPDEITSLAIAVQKGQSCSLPLASGGVELEPADLKVELVAEQGWAAQADRETVAILDIRLTKELKSEGLAREVIRHVQQQRKDANLELEDRIQLGLQSSDAGLLEAIQAHRDYIKEETLAVDLHTTPIADATIAKSVKLEGVPLDVSLRKAPS